MMERLGKRKLTNRDLGALAAARLARQPGAAPPQPGAALDLGALAAERESRRRQGVAAPRPAAAAASASRRRPAEEAWVASATCSRLNITRGGDNPIVAFENFGGDRGLRLSTIAGIKATVEQHTRESDTNTYASRRAIDTASAVGGPDICAAMQRAADRLMALASDELRRRGDRVGEHALRPAMRTPWTRTSTLIYPAGATLSRHSDGCGNWVVLFSFGRTATFFCGDASEDLESGDAILFNGGTRFDVEHGIDLVHGYASSYDATSDTNQPAPLPREMGYLDAYRVSVQVRQQDPPPSWGWPVSRVEN